MSQTGREIWLDLHEELRSRFEEDDFVSEDPAVELLERAATLLSEAAVGIQQRIRLGHRED